MSDFKIEEVESVEQPPKARVQDVVEAPAERQRDYLSGFLSQKPTADDPTQPGGALYDGIIDALKDIFDPKSRSTSMTWADLRCRSDRGRPCGRHHDADHPALPVAESMPGEVELRVSAVPGIATADVNLVWDPPWDPQKMSDDAKLELGML